MTYDHWKTTDPDWLALESTPQWTEADDLCEEDHLAREEAEWQMQDRQRNQ
jgi:hypothetical protein